MTSSKQQAIAQAFSVQFSYPVLFTHDVFAPGNHSLADCFKGLDEEGPHRVVVFADDGLIRCRPDLPARINGYFAEHRATLNLVREPYLVPGGDRIKNDYRLIMSALDLMLEYRLCRHSVVLVIGGGAVLDAIGFAASLVHRGLRVVRLPSTVLSQNDAGLGVKTGMNLHGGKNTIGTFHPPFAVVNDFDLLSTLDDAHWRSGIAEALKVAIIKDRDFFDYLAEHAVRLRERDARSMEYLVRHCAELHLEHIRTSGDAFEYGRARPLDFGHWAAHKLECMTGYVLPHGTAVAVGISIDSAYAMEMGWISSDELNTISSALAAAGLPTWNDTAGRRAADGTFEILVGLDDFREHLGGRLTVTYPNGIGRLQEVHDIDLAVMTSVMQRLQQNHIKHHAHSAQARSTPDILS